MYVVSKLYGDILLGRLLAICLATLSDTLESIHIQVLYMENSQRVFWLVLCGKIHEEHTILTAV